MAPRGPCTRSFSMMPRSLTRMSCPCCSRAFPCQTLWRPHSGLLGISFMSHAELERWLLERDWAAFRRELCAKWAEVQAVRELVKAPHDSHGQAHMILAVSFARNQASERDLARAEIGCHGTHQESGIVVHRRSKGEPLAQPNVYA